MLVVAAGPYRCDGLETETEVGTGTVPAAGAGIIAQSGDSSIVSLG